MLVGTARFGMKDKDLGLKNLPCRDRLALFRSGQGSIMTRDFEQVTWTPQHAQDQGV